MDKLKLSSTSQSRETRGLLDWMDILLGRLSSRTNPDGTRIRSWGATFCFWMTVPSMIFMLSYGSAILIVALSTRNHVSTKALALYVACVQKAEKTDKIGKRQVCPVPKTDGAKLSPKILDVGQWPFVLAMFFPLLGFVGMTLRNKDDLNALKALLDTAQGFASKGLPIPTEIMDSIKNQATKITGANVERTPHQRGARQAPTPGIDAIPGPPPGAVDDAGQ